MVVVDAGCGLGDRVCGCRGSDLGRGCAQTLGRLLHKAGILRGGAIVLCFWSGCMGCKGSKVTAGLGVTLMLGFAWMLRWWLKSRCVGRGYEWSAVDSLGYEVVAALRHHIS